MSWGPNEPGEMSYPESGDEPETKDEHDMIIGLGTHFNARISMDELRMLAPRVQAARIDAQTSSGELTRQMIADVQSVGMVPLVIFDLNSQLEEIPDGIAVEKQNEVNIGLGRPAPIPPAQYRDDALAGYEIATRKGCSYWAGAAANFEKRDIDWFHELDFKSWPADIGCATHHYVPRDTFEQAHKLNWKPSTWTREYEVEQFKAAIGAHAWGITEFGYRGTPEHVATQMRKEWAFWQAQGCHWAFMYQIRDSPETDHDFGLLDDKNVLKQAIWDTFPHAVAIDPIHTEETPMLEVHDALRRKDALKHPTRVGYFTSPHPDGDGTVLSVEADRTIGKRPHGTAGPWETWRDDGTKAVFEDAHGGVAILLVD